MIRIVNLRNYVAKDNEVLIKVDRSNKILGNKFYMKAEAYRNKVCDDYANWFNAKVNNNDISVMQELNRILIIARNNDIALGCWCYPKRCHSETIKAWLENNLNNKGVDNMNVIDSFRNEFSFLSNMYPCNIKFRDMEFSCSEALFQALKCKTTEEMKAFVGIDGKKAKALGRKVKLRDDWNNYRIRAMQIALICKFAQNPELLIKLKNTGNAMLIEGNNWNDNFWGKCNGKGLNHLGLMLMKIRAKL